MNLGINIGISIGGQNAGENLGANLIQNSTFDANLDTWANRSSHWQWVAGEAYHPSSSSFLPLMTDYDVFEIDKTYRIDYSLRIITGDVRVSAFYLIDVNNLDEIDVHTVSGTYTNYFTGVVNRLKLGFSRDTIASEFYLDNVIVREVL